MKTNTILRAPRLLCLGCLCGLWLALATACKPQEDTSPVLDDPRQAARDALVAEHRSCFEDEPGACLTDPAFVDAVLDKAVAQRLKGQFPKTQRGVTRLVESVRGSYAVAQTKTPEVRAQVQQKLQAMYEDPEVKAERKGLVAELGILPHEIVPGLRSGWRVSSKGPLMEEYQWRGAEAARHFRRLSKAHPEAAFIELRLRVPRFSSLERWRYRWEPARGQVRVAGPGDRVRFSITPHQPDVLGALASGAQTFDSRALVRCQADENDVYLHADCNSAPRR